MPEENLNKSHPENSGDREKLSLTRREDRVVIIAGYIAEKTHAYVTFPEAEFYHRMNG